MPVEKAHPEIRSACPTCGTNRPARDNGTQPIGPMPYHDPATGVYVGDRVATRYLICPCGQRYAVPVIQARPAPASRPAEPAPKDRKFSGHRKNEPKVSGNRKPS